MDGPVAVTICLRAHLRESRVAILVRREREREREHCVWCSDNAYVDGRAWEWSWPAAYRHRVSDLLLLGRSIEESLPPGKKQSCSKQQLVTFPIFL